jgi:glycerol kinase
MAIDQGTTGTRVILFDHEGDVHSSSYREIRQYFPKPGWVEHDPREHWDTVMLCAKEALAEGRVRPEAQRARVHRAPKKTPARRSGKVCTQGGRRR